MHVLHVYDARYMLTVTGDRGRLLKIASNIEMNKCSGISFFFFGGGASPVLSPSGYATELHYLSLRCQFAYVVSASSGESTYAAIILLSIHNNYCRITVISKHAFLNDTFANPRRVIFFAAVVNFNNPDYMLVNGSKQCRWESFPCRFNRKSIAIN